MDIFQFCGIQQNFGSGSLINIGSKSFTREEIQNWINILENETPEQIGDRLLKLSAQLREERKRQESENKSKLVDLLCRKLPHRADVFRALAAKEVTDLDSDIH